MSLAQENRPANEDAGAVADEGLAHLIARDSHAGRYGRMLGRLVDAPRIGRTFARLARAPIKVRFASTRLTRLHAGLLRLSGGRLRRSWLFAAGQPVLALTTTGRKSGLSRTTAVACFTHGGDLAVAGMNLGMPRAPAWALNLQADPRAWIELGGRRLAVTASQAADQEAEALWQRWVRLQPSAVAYRDLARREIPLFVLRPRTDHRAG